MPDEPISQHPPSLARGKHADRIRQEYAARLAAQRAETDEQRTTRLAAEQVTIDEQVWVELTREQARTVRLALATQRRFYEEQLSSGIKGLALPGQERVSYTQRLQETIESQGAITLALADPGATP